MCGMKVPVTRRVSVEGWTRPFAMLLHAILMASVRLSQMAATAVFAKKGSKVQVTTVQVANIYYPLLPTLKIIFKTMSTW